jgi:hypothetical protein
MSDMAYYDLESYDLEIEDCVELAQIRTICAKLQLDLFSLLGLAYGAPVKNLGALLRARRIEKEFSIRDVSDRVGIFESAIDEAENNPETLEKWHLKPLRDYARSLGIDLEILLGRGHPQRCGWTFLTTWWICGCQSKVIGAGYGSGN